MLKAFKAEMAGSALAVAMSINFMSCKTALQYQFITDVATVLTTTALLILLVSSCQYLPSILGGQDKDNTKDVCIMMEKPGP